MTSIVSPAHENFFTGAIRNSIKISFSTLLQKLVANSTKRNFVCSFVFLIDCYFLVSLNNFFNKIFLVLKSLSLKTCRETWLGNSWSKKAKYKNSTDKRRGISMHGQKDNIAELLMFKVVDHWLTSYKENQTTELTFYDVA